MRMSPCMSVTVVETTPTKNRTFTVLISLRHTTEITFSQLSLINAVKLHHEGSELTIELPVSHRRHCTRTFEKVVSRPEHH